ncbi:MAG: ASCH domain-containing protein [Nocardioidaceae bacterium]
MTSQPQEAPELEPEVAAFWAEYADARGIEGEPADVYSFGDNPELADELLALVLSGRKTATTEMVARFAADGLPLPRIGDRCVVTDSAGRPAAVLRTVELRLGPMSGVHPRFAFDEGEGDRSVESWLRGHDAYFRRSCEELGIAFSRDIEVVFERFVMVWPRAGAVSGAPRTG